MVISRNGDANGNGKRKGPGRPTKRTPEVEELLKRAWSRGLSNTTAAHLAGIHVETLRLWLRDDPDFLATKRQCAASTAISVVDAVVEKAIAGDMKAADLYLTRRTREFRDQRKLDVKHSGKQTHEITTEAPQPDAARFREEMRQWNRLAEEQGLL